jgi:uncharacterized protein YeaO (DUF488 family)
MDMIAIKRVYEAPAKQDGKRFLVERLWPRGIKKEALKMDGWLKDAAPSHVLRRWFGHDPEKWLAFKRHYFEELAQEPEAVRTIIRSARQGSVTLLYSAHDTVHNNAAALKEFLEKRMSRRKKSMPLKHVASAPRE